MGRLIDVDEYEKRIKPYDTEDAMDKALYNFAHDHLVTTPTAQPQDIARDIATIPEQPTGVQDILQYLDEYLHPIVSPEHWSVYSELYDMVSMLPSEQPQRWISVTEDTPKKRDWYLGIFKEPDTGWINPLPFICDYVGRETKATTKEGWILRGYTEREEHIDYYFNLECVAWMPLPESYKGEQDG